MLARSDNIDPDDTMPLRRRRSRSGCGGYPQIGCVASSITLLAFDIAMGRSSMGKSAWNLVKERKGNRAKERKEFSEGL